MWFTSKFFCSSLCFNSKKAESSFCGRDSSTSVSPILLTMLLLSFYCAPLTSRMFTFFGLLPFSCLTLFQEWFISVFLLREFVNFSQSSFLLFFAWVLNSAQVFFSTGWGVASDWFSWIFYRIILFCHLVFVAGYSTRAWRSVFYLYHRYSRCCGNLD